MNIYTLNNSRDLRTKQRHEYYNKILNRCYNRIKTVSKTRTFCFFKIPRIVIGIPLFNIIKCSNYIFKLLIQKGFKVSQIKTNYLLIYWGHIQSYISNPKLKNNEIQKPRKKKPEIYRNINDVDNNNQNFIYDLPEFNNKINNILK